MSPPPFTMEVMELNYSFVTFKVLCNISFPFCGKITTSRVMGIHSSKPLNTKKHPPIFHFHHFRRQGERYSHEADCRHLPAVPNLSHSSVIAEILMDRFPVSLSTYNARDNILRDACWKGIQYLFLNFGFCHSLKALFSPGR